MREFEQERVAERRREHDESVQEAPSTTVCETCEGGGWVQVYSPHPPAFEVCPDCYNPDGNECP